METIAEAEEKRWGPYKVKFYANEIPETTTKPLYKKLMQDNKERRENVKRESIRMTLENENPFSFYERDKNKK